MSYLPATHSANASNATGGTWTCLRDCVADFARRGWMAWKRHRQLARGATELARMDDRLLRDIGLTRFDVAALGTHPTPRDEL